MLDRHEDAAAPELERLLQRRLQLGRDLLALIGPGALGHDDELVPAEAGDGVAGTRSGGEAGGDGTQQRVAGVVPERVVDDLEPVDVDEQHRQRSRRPVAPLGRLGQPVGEQRAVGQVGHGVVEGQPAQRCFSPPDLGDVRDHGERADAGAGAVVQRAAAHAEPAPAALRVLVLDVVLLGPALRTVTQAQGEERRLPGAEHLQAGRPQACSDGPSEQLGHLGVHVERPSGGVRDPDALLRGLDDRPVPLLRALQRTLGLDLRGDVAQVEHEAADVAVVEPVAQGGLDPAPAAVGVSVAVGGGRRGPRRPGDALEGGAHICFVVGMHVVVAVAAEHVLRREAEHQLAGGAAVEDAAVSGVHHRDVGGPLDERPEQRLLLLQLLLRPPERRARRRPRHGLGSGVLVAGVLVDALRAGQDSSLRPWAGGAQASDIIGWTGPPVAAAAPEPSQGTTCPPEGASHVAHVPTRSSSVTGASN